MWTGGRGDGGEEEKGLILIERVGWWVGESLSCSSIVMQLYAALLGGCPHIIPATILAYWGGI